jgi:hypothetical protein
VPNRPPTLSMYMPYSPPNTLPAPPLGPISPLADLFSRQARAALGCRASSFQHPPPSLTATAARIQARIFPPVLPPGQFQGELYWSLHLFDTAGNTLFLSPFLYNSCMQRISYESMVLFHVDFLADIPSKFEGIYKPVKLIVRKRCGTI